MGKRLLTPDYDKFVSTSFNLSYADQFKHYHNILDEHYKYNNDILVELARAINRKFEQYKNQIYGGPVRVLLENGEIITADRMQTWGQSDDGKRTPHDLLKTKIHFKVDSDSTWMVDGYFFMKQIAILTLLFGNIELKEKIIDFENDQPEEVLKKISKEPFPDGFDYNDIKERFYLIKTEYERYNKENKTNLIGFDCKFSDPLRDKIWQKMVEKKHITCDSDDFRAIFTDSLIKTVKPIQWNIMYRNKGHKSALRGFLELMLGGINLDSVENQKKIKVFFTFNGNGMSLSKKKDDSKYKRIFRILISECKEIYPNPQPDNKPTK